MKTLLRSLSAQRRRLAGEQSGFTLIEVVVASGVLMLAMSGLAYLGTVAFTDIATARLRQTATALANESVEQVRAMPYDRVKIGLKTSDLGSDPLVTWDGSHYRFGGERIPHAGDATDLAPIVPHMATNKVDATPYTVAVYITHYEDVEFSGAYRITSLVSWTSGLRASTVKQVEVETVVFSPSCGSDATHVFAAPCEPFFHASSAVTPGGITIEGPSSTVAPLPGSDLERLTFWLPDEKSTIEAEQVTTVDSDVTTSGVGVRASGSTTDTVSGRLNAVAASGTDPGRSAPEHDTDTTGSQASASSTFTGTGASLGYTSAGGDTGVATATVVAKAGNPCDDESNPPVAIVSERACGNSTTHGSGSSAVLTVAGFDTPLVTMGTPSSSSAAHGAIVPVATGTRCPTAVSTDDGCIRAGHRRVVGATQIGGLPGGVTPPIGFDWLVKIDETTTAVSAEAGDKNAQPTASSIGSMHYWNGFDYTSVDLSAGASVALPVPVLSVSDLVTGVEVTMTPNLRTGSLSAPACAAPCADASAEAESPVIGTIAYVVKVSGVTVADLLIRVEYGTVSARAVYKASS